MIFPGQVSGALTEFFSATGKLSISVDGGGSEGEGISSHTISVDKPNSSATVRTAFVLGASQGFSTQSRPIGNGEVTIERSDLDPNFIGAINWVEQVSGPVGNFNHRADVTSLIKPIVDLAPPGRFDFFFGENPTELIEGEILVVVFDDPTQNEDSTIILLFGQQALAGDAFTVSLANSVNPETSGAFINMGVGISNSLANVAPPNPNQVHLIDINGTRLSSAAGGNDDGEGFGATITVGGLDDSLENPTDPLASPGTDERFDDELYSLLPFITAADTNIRVNTQNPTNDDNLFFTYFQTSPVAVLGPGIMLTPTSATNDVGTDHTVTAKVVDGNGDPVPSTLVMFSVVSGPNSNESGTDVTDDMGEATFTYAGNGGEGTDTIQASFVGPQEETIPSNPVIVTFNPDAPPVVTPPAPLTLATPASVSKSDPRIQMFLSAATASDVIDGALMPTNNAPAVFPFGPTLVTFTATDSVGNTGVATATVNITLDGTPVVTAPASLMLTSPTSVLASDTNIQTFLNAATATDTIDGVLTPTNNAPAVFPFGTAIVTFSAIDFEGNTSMAMATVTVEPAPLAVIAFNDGADVNPGDQICETEFGNGVCTLRAAIQEANAQEGEETITLPPGTYTLSLPGTNEDNAVAGDLDITDTLIITSSTNNAGDVIISGNGLDRVFDLSQGNPSVTINGITIQDGNIIGSTGGGIRNVTGALIVENSVVTSNRSDGSGGGISHLNGTLVIRGTTVSNNSSQGRGGGVQAQDGTVTIEANSQFTGNQANFGGGLSTGNANVTVTDSILIGNSATDGGGIFKFLHPGNVFSGIQAPTVRLEGTTKLENNTINDCDGFLIGDPSMVGNVGTPVRCQLVPSAVVPVPVVVSPAQAP